MIPLADSALSTVDNEGRALARTVGELRDFWLWFGDSVAIDKGGRPIVAYRGEYGQPDSLAGFNTRLGSLSFGDRETAYRLHITRTGARTLRFIRGCRSDT